MRPRKTPMIKAPFCNDSIQPRIWRISKDTIDFGEFGGRKLQVVLDGDDVLDLAYFARSDQGRGHRLVAQDPGNRHPGEALAASPGDDIEQTDFGHLVFGYFLR